MNNGHCKIINPKYFPNLEKYCNGSIGIKVTHCNGLGEEYCKKTCFYAKVRFDENANTAESDLGVGSLMDPGMLEKLFEVSNSDKEDRV